MHRIVALAVLTVLPFLGGCAHRYGYVVPEMKCPPPAEVPPGHVHGPGCGHMLVAGVWCEYDEEFAEKLRAWHEHPEPVRVPIWDGPGSHEGPTVIIPR